MIGYELPVMIPGRPSFAGTLLLGCSNVHVRSTLYKQSWRHIGYQILGEDLHEKDKKKKKRLIITDHKELDSSGFFFFSFLFKRPA